MQTYAEVGLDSTSKGQLSTIYIKIYYFFSQKSIYKHYSELRFRSAMAIGILPSLPIGL